MAGKDIIIMSQKELKRVPVIHNVLNKQLRQIDAANILRLSTRQIRRIIKRLKQEGDIAVVHRSRGCSSNRSISPKLRGKILYLCKTKYKGFNPTFASEKLFEIDRIKINHETLRGWFIKDGIDYQKRKARKHRSWRPRREAFGQMVQMDGSHHDWLEGRGPWCVLMGYIDDATGRIFGHFYEYEGTKPAFDSFKRYIRQYGMPQSVYLDKHTTYKSSQKPTMEDEFANQKAQSQFERALSQLGVDVIHANSPQAKGRIERSFKTHQDRLVKELRLKNISSLEEANRFLHSYYIPKHNARYALVARNKANLHRPIPKELDLDRVFSVRNKLALRNDFTARHNNRFYQILEPVRAKEVILEERLNGRLYIYHKDRQLEYKPIDKKPEKPRLTYRPRKPRYVPPQDHIYRRFKIKCA